MLHSVFAELRLSTKPNRWTAVVALACALLACDDGGGNETKTNEPPQTLPSVFQDTLGQSWTCPDSDDGDAELSGQFSINEAIPVKRADILHLTLLELYDDSVQQITQVCINNILAYSANFTLTYPESNIDSELRYLLSARLFQKLEDDNYQMALAPDGLIEVINNGVVDDIEINLEPF